MVISHSVRSPQKVTSGWIDPELFTQFHLGDVPLGQGIEDFANRRGATFTSASGFADSFALGSTFASASGFADSFTLCSPSRLSDCFALRPALLVRKMKLGALDAKCPRAGT